MKINKALSILIVTMMVVLAFLSPMVASGTTVLYAANFSSYPNGATPAGWWNSKDAFTIENGTYQHYTTSPGGWTVSYYTGQVFTNFRLTVLASGLENCVQSPPVLAVVFRASSAVNNYYFWGDIDKIQIQKYVNGQWQWPSSGVAWKSIGQITPYGQWYNITVTVSGDSITANWNNQFTLTATDSQFSSGYVGVATYNCNAEFSNFIVTGLPAVSSSSIGSSTTSPATTTSSSMTSTASSTATDTTSTTVTTTTVVSTCLVTFTEVDNQTVGTQIGSCQ